MNIFAPLLFGQYFKAGCAEVVVTIATLTLHKKSLLISVFAYYLKVADLPFYRFFGKLPKFLNFFASMRVELL